MQHTQLPKLSLDERKEEYMEQAGKKENHAQRCKKNAQRVCLPPVDNFSISDCDCK